MGEGTEVSEDGVEVTEVTPAGEEGLDPPTVDLPKVAVKEKVPLKRL